MMLPNPHIAKMSEDLLYHFAISTATHDLPAMFGDVKFVVVGGSPRRMEKFAYAIAKAMKHEIPTGQKLTNISGNTDRFAMFKVGPVLAVSHGMGMTSVSIMMHEMIKLIHHAGCSDVTFIRIGTCGGIGIAPGTVVVSDSVVDGCMTPHMELHILGKSVRRPATFDSELTTELGSCGKGDDGFQTLLGKTMCTTDFYEEQARLDGAFCDFEQSDKTEFLQKCIEQGVKNFDMESLCFAAMLNHAGIKGAVCCAALLNRMEGDQVDSPRELLQEWEQRPTRIVSRFICKRLGLE